MKQTKRSPKKTITQRELAEVLGISPALLNYHLKTGKAPALDDIDGWNEHLALNSREGGLPRDVRKKIGEQRCRLIKAQADRVEGDNKARTGKVIDRATVQQGILAASSVLFTELDRHFCNELPPVLAGLDPLAIRKKCQETIEKLRVSLNEKFAALAD